MFGRREIIESSRTHAAMASLGVPAFAPAEALPGGCPFEQPVASAERFATAHPASQRSPPCLCGSAAAKHEPRGSRRLRGRAGRCSSGSLLCGSKRRSECPLPPLRPTSAGVVPAAAALAVTGRGGPGGGGGPIDAIGGPVLKRSRRSYDLVGLEREAVAKTMDAAASALEAVAVTQQEAAGFEAAAWI